MLGFGTQAKYEMKDGSDALRASLPSFILNFAFHINPTPYKPSVVRNHQLYLRGEQCTIPGIHHEISVSGDLADGGYHHLHTFLFSPEPYLSIPPPHLLIPRNPTNMDCSRCPPRILSTLSGNSSIIYAVEAMRLIQN